MDEQFYPLFSKHTAAVADMSTQNKVTHRFYKKFITFEYTNCQTLSCKKYNKSFHLVDKSVSIIILK
jgi:hypothetical protein